MLNRLSLHPTRLILVLSLGLLIFLTGHAIAGRHVQAETEPQHSPYVAQLTPTLPPFNGGALLFAPIIHLPPAPPEPTCLTTDTEPNDISANATLPICFDTDLNGTINSQQDQTDIYRLVLDFPGDLSIQLDALSGDSAIIVMTLFGSNGELIQHDGSNAANKRFSIENAAAGIYFLTISDASESQATQPYTIRFTVAYDVTPTPTVTRPANQTETPAPINSTATSTATLIPTGAATGQPTNTPQANPTATPITFPSVTPAPGTATNTPQPVATLTAQPNLSATPQPTATHTPAPNATATPQPVATQTNTPQPTATRTPTPLPAATNTPQPQPTSTNTPQPPPTNTAVPTATPTATATNPPLPTATPTATATPTTAPNNSPNTPGSPFPSNGATVSTTSPLLTWSGGDPDGDSVTYDVFFQFQFGSEQLLCNDVTTRRCSTGTLTNGFDYSWRVVATDSKGASTSGPTWTFFVNDGGPLP